MKQLRSFMHMKSIIVFCVVAVSIPFIAKADLFDQLVIAIKAGDSKQVSQYFNKTIDFATPTLSDVYSKAQAEILLKDFFVSYPPKAFTIQHRGSSAQGTKYIIGKYDYDKGSLRVYILIKEQNGQQLIQELHFEKE